MSLFSSSSFTLKDNLENLYLGGGWYQSTAVTYGESFLNIGGYTFGGFASINGTGNAKNNIIYGTGGNNVLDGAAGNDFMAGGDGNDTYIVDSASDYLSEFRIYTAGLGYSAVDSRGTNYQIHSYHYVSSGIDLVQSSTSWTLGNLFENLTLTGEAAIHGIGNYANNIITGNKGANSIYGYSGNDSLSGGEGNDTIDGGILNDTIIAGSGNDSVYGGIGDDYLSGDEGNDIIYGDAGNDTLVAGGGDNTLYGGTGSDVYNVYDTTIDPTSPTPSGITTIVEEQAAIDVGGFDVVYSPYSWTLGYYLEDLVLKGTYDIDGTGNDLDNDITGNSHNNLIRGNGRDDTISAGQGADTLEGGTGNDSLDTGIDSFGNDDSAIDLIKFSATSNNDTVETGYSTVPGQWDQVIIDMDSDTDASTLAVVTFDRTNSGAKEDLIITVTEGSSTSTLTVLGFYKIADPTDGPSASGDPISRISGVYDENGAYLTTVLANGTSGQVTFDYLWAL